MKIGIAFKTAAWGGLLFGHRVTTDLIRALSHHHVTGENAAQRVNVAVVGLPEGDFGADELGRLLWVLDKDVKLTAFRDDAGFGKGDGSAGLRQIAHFNLLDGEAEGALFVAAKLLNRVALNRWSGVMIVIFAGMAFGAVIVPSMVV